MGLLTASKVLNHGEIDRIRVGLRERSEATKEVLESEEELEQKVDTILENQAFIFDSINKLLRRLT